MQYYVASISTPAPSPSPAPSASPSGPTDPCGSLLSIVGRPTISTSTCTVPDGKADVETGYSNTTITGIGGGSTVSYPQAFVRVGIAHHLELSVLPPSFNRTSVGGAIASGSGDMNFGVKWEAGYSAKALWGAYLQVSAPTGVPAFTAGGTGYTCNLNWGYALNSVWALNGTLGFNSLTGYSPIGQLQRYGAFVPTLELTAALPQNSQAFAEYAYFSHAGPGTGAKSIIDFGYQHDFGEHVQFDVEYGFQPDAIEGQKLHYIGAGLSFMT